MYNVTQTFNNLSAEVIDIESKLRESGQHSISNLVRKIQLKEKEKLEMVRFSVGQLEKKNETQVDYIVGVKGCSFTLMHSNPQTLQQIV